MAKWIVAKVDRVLFVEGLFLFLVNDSSSRFFHISTGLRQGDILLPFFFVIALEVFSHLLEKDIGGGYLFGCSIWGRDRRSCTVTYCWLMTP